MATIEYKLKDVFDWPIWDSKLNYVINDIAIDDLKIGYDDYEAVVFRVKVGEQVFELEEVSIVVEVENEG